MLAQRSRAIPISAVCEDDAFREELNPSYELPIAVRDHSAASSVLRFRFDPAPFASTGARNLPV
jgi:hypothetical protein